MTEGWRPVVGYEGIYEVSSLGRVRRIIGGQGAIAGRILTPTPLVRGGYLFVWLYRGGKRTQGQIHQLVALAFIGPRPDGLEVRHMDGDPVHNEPSNLSWGTRSQNIADQVRHGTHPQASKVECIRGHVFDEENTRTRRGRRECRACARERYHERSAA